MIAQVGLEQYHFVEQQRNHSVVAALHDFPARDVHLFEVQVGMEMVLVVIGGMPQEPERQIGC